MSTRAPVLPADGLRVGRPLVAFAAAAVGFGAARALTTTYVPVLLEEIDDAPWLIGLVMLINAAAGLTVPILAGVATDRRRAGGLGRRGGIMLWGAGITGGGLLAVALGTGSSYLALTAAAAGVYVGLNIATTAHRAVVADAFPDALRPRATSAQELAALAGALVGTLAGGALIESAPAAAFLVVGLLLAASLAPTLRLRLVREAGAGVTAAAPRGARATRETLREIARLPGAREVLVAQALWVTAYGALPTFLILYADHVLGVGIGTASILVVAFGALAGVGTLVAGRLRPEHVGPGLVLGVGLMGAGSLAVLPADSVQAAAVPFATVALGQGLATALGYPYFTRFVPADRAGRAAGLFFSVRSVGSAVALPVGGGLAAVAGYRYLWVLGAAALLALVPLLRTLPGGLTAVRGRGAPAGGPLLPEIRRLAVIVPYLDSERVGEVAARAAAQPGVVDVLLVDDGAPPHIAAAVDRLAADVPSVRSVRPDRHGGKAAAVAAGLEALGDLRGLDAVAVVDSDLQHPPELLPAFAAAARGADAVIGDRRDRAGAMPRVRRAANAGSSLLLALRTRHRIPDGQNGMRLYRVGTLERVPLPPGGFDVETAHLRALLRGGARVAWQPMPTIYNGEPSSFRPLVDSARVLAAIARPGQRDATAPAPVALRATGRLWGPRLALTVAAGWLAGALLPLFQGLDERLYLEINHLGDGPEWLYAAVDPHLRNYMLLVLLALLAAGLGRRSARAALGAAATVAAAGIFANLLMQLVRLWVDRPRPQEVLGAEAWLSHARDWSGIASFPSGHVVVTTAMVVAAVAAVPRLRYALVPYVLVIAATRILFGAHFPADVAVGLVVGVIAGAFVVDGARALRLLPARAPVRAVKLGGLRDGPQLAHAG